MNKAFLISTVTALALGYTAGFATNGLNAQAAVSADRDFSYSFVPGAAAKSAVTSWVQSNACSKLDDELSLSGGNACDAAKDLSEVCFERAVVDGATTVKARVTFRRAGTYTPAAPQ